MDARERGFTLIEIILATALFALLMSSYYVVFSQVVELEEYARSQRAFGAVGPAVLDLVEDDLLSLYSHPRALEAYPLRGEDDSMASEPADRINFVTHRASIHQEDFYGSDGGWVRSPVNEVGYRLASGRSGRRGLRRLFRREGYYVDATPLQGGDFYEIYDRVVGFELRYVGYPAEEEERTDQDTLGDHTFQVFESWDSEERKWMPTAVLVTLTIEPPQLTVKERERDVDEAPPRRTFLRIIHIPQADDILPQQTNDAQSPTGQPTNNQPQGNR